MRESVLARIDRDEEIQLYHYGMEQCEKGHYFGPAVRDHYLIHFILEGRGYFKVGERVYNLSKNQAFLILPGIVTYYQADIDTPWTYCWLGFNGIKAYTILKESNLTLKNPILEFDDSSTIPHLMGQMLSTDINTPGGNLKLKGLLYMVLSEIQKVNNGWSLQENIGRYKEIYVEKALDFIEKNYSRDISISDIAKYVGLDRSYFSTLFKQSMNVSPQGYLINFRMKKAAELLKSTALAVGDIARSIGYSDPLCFSKVFKKTVGMSPLKYRCTIG